MRTLTEQEERIIASGSYGADVRVWVANAAGTLVDLTERAGVEWVEGVSISEGVDEPHVTAEIEVRREVYDWSLAPLRSASALNTGMSPGGTYSPALDVGREVRIDVALARDGEGVDEPAPLPPSPNLLANSSFETGLTGYWSAGSVSGVTSAVARRTGTQCLQWTGTGAVAPYTTNGTSAGGLTGLAASPGQQFTASAYCQRGAAGSTLQYVALRFYNAAGTQLVSTGSTPKASPNGAWTRHTVTATAPANTAFAKVWLIGDGALTSGHLVWWDDVQLELAATASTYRLSASEEPVEPSPWKTLFHGRIDRLPGAGESITIECRDLGGRLADRYIEEERVYAFDASGTAIKGLRVWAKETAYALNDLVLPSTLTGHYYRCTTAGVSGATPPTWPTSGTTPFADGTVQWTREAATSSAGKPVETVMQSILDDTLGAGAVTLYTPTSPGWVITEFKQDRVPVLEALRALAGQIGWDVRYAWHEASEAFRLTLAGPDRAKVTPDREVQPTEYQEVEQLAVSVEDIRNAVAVIYSDRADLDPAGRPRRKRAEATSPTSIARYGRRYMEVAEDEASNIDSGTEAADMAAAILSDLAEPEAELGVTDLLRPEVQLGDLLEFAPNGTHWDDPLALAVVGYRHDLRDGGGFTALTLRGRPSAGKDRWLAIETRPGGKPNRSEHLLPATSPPTISAGTIIGGAQLSAAFGGQTVDAAHLSAEWHVSTSPGFTPSAATLKAEGLTAAVSNLTPGVTYYARAVPIGRDGDRIVRGYATPPVSFVAGRVTSGHMGLPHAVAAGTGVIAWGASTATITDPSGLAGVDSGAWMQVTPQVMDPGAGVWGAKNNNDGTFTVEIDGTPTSIAEEWPFSWVIYIPAP